MMTTTRTYRRCLELVRECRHRASGLFVAAMLSAAAHAQNFSIADTPLIVAQPLEPNIVLTVDDSAVMQNAFAPDSAFANRNAAKARHFKSVAFNPLYYNPSITYVVPPHASATATSFSAALANGFDATQGAINLAAGYRPTYSYDPTVSATNNGHVLADHFSAADATAVGASGVTGAGAAHYYIYDTTLSGCTSSTSDDNCYRLQLVTASSGPGGSDERPNFARWYSYYRTRNLAISSAAARSMSAATLQSARVAFQGLNSCNSFANNASLCNGFLASGNNQSQLSTSVSNLIREFGTTARDDLYAWLRRLPASGNSTPLRVATARAGDYYRNTSSNSPNSPYYDRPNTNSPGSERSCRPNFHILMAGGGYDDDNNGNYCSGAGCGNKDGSTFTLGDGTSSYSPRAPFADGGAANTNSLADVALHYWGTDLRPTLSNNLLPYIRDKSGGSFTAQFWNPKNDPATWQHMINFTVGIGLGATLTDPNIPWAGSTFAGTGYQNLLNGQAWPSTATESGRVYDLWHAAINSRGEFFSADTPTEMVAALDASFGRTIAQSNVGAALAANSTRLTTQSLLYQASFDTGDWTGRLRAIRINTDGSLSGTNVWEATASGQIGSWDPSAVNARKIFTSDALTNGIPFVASNAFVLGKFGGDANLVNYLRGQQSNEQANGGALRNRSVLLGDIVNSEMAFTAAEDFGYAVLPENAALLATSTDYASWLTNTKSTRIKMLYVGANDGTMRGIDADTGAEKFAYVPRALLNDPISGTDQRSKLALLADPAYTHRFYVDGSPWIGDAFNGSSWRTMVVGTTGAGGKGVFALDVTAPSSFSASNVIFDLDGSTEPDLGFTIGQAVIGRLRDGNFYAIFGNGYRSANECAVLYLVNLTNANIIRISTTEGNLNSVSRTSSANACATPNGLGRPSLHDQESSTGPGDRVTDYVYAADIRGNVWKFDLTNATPTNWTVAFSSGGNPAPFYTAEDANGNRQPITGTIEIGRPPQGVSGTGAAMLWFGTGRYFADQDKTDTSPQTVYGLLDRGAGNSAIGTGRGSLVQQTINASTRNLSTSTVNYGSGQNGNRQGWYADLPASGERVVNLPLIQRGRLFVATLIPPADKCDGGGSSVIQAFNPYSGGALVNSPYVTASAVNFGASIGRDAVTSTVGVIRNLVYIDAGTRAYLYGGGSSGNVLGQEVRPEAQDPGTARGRVSWREIIPGQP